MQQSSRMMSQNYTIKLHKDIFSRKHVNELVNEIKRAIENNILNIYIDFSEVQSIDIIGFGVLRTIQKIAIINNAKIILFDLKENVKKIMQSSCLILDILDEEEENRLNDGGALIA